MATSQIASMLDELMGRNRNAHPSDQVREQHWSDPEICRYFVCKFCPHDLFTNTKADLGTCPKIHDESLKRQFQEDKDSLKKANAMDDFLRFGNRMLSELQARIKKAKERLTLTQNDDAPLLPPTATPIHKDTEDKIQLISKRINTLVEEAEAAGCQGNVEQAQGLMKLSDQLREEREKLRRSLMPFLKEEYTQQQKAMEVCDTCGAFLIVGDAQQRIDDHLMGKQHLGYAKLRQAVDEITEERKKMREERDKEMEELRKKREEERSSSRRRSRERSNRKSRDRDIAKGGDKEKGKKRSRSKERKRSRSRDRRERKRSRSRDKKRTGSKERRRSRSKDKRRSSKERSRRSRSRDKRNKSRERSSRHRSRSPRKRSRSKDRRRRSRSKEERRKRSRSRDRSSKDEHKARKQQSSDNHDLAKEGEQEKMEEKSGTEKERSGDDSRLNGSHAKERSEDQKPEKSEVNGE